MDLGVRPRSDRERAGVSPGQHIRTVPEDRPGTQPVRGPLEAWSESLYWVCKLSLLKTKPPCLSRSGQLICAQRCFCPTCRPHVSCHALQLRNTAGVGWRVCLVAVPSADQGATAMRRDCFHSSDSPTRQQAVVEPRPAGTGQREQSRDGGLRSCWAGCKSRSNARRRLLAPPL